MGATLLSFGFTIMQLALKYGIPAAVKIVNGWLDAGNRPTKESFDQLRENHRAPEEFLTEAQRRVLGLERTPAGEE